MRWDIKELKHVLAREISILALILFITYFFELIFLIFHEGPVGPSIPFWKDQYAYQIWNNSLRENAHILRFLGYPLLLAMRYFLWVTKIPETKKIERSKQKSYQVKSLLEDIIEELNLDKIIEDVIYRPGYAWYIVRFQQPPSCLIPEELIVNYIDSEGKIGRKEIVNLLLHRDINTD